MSLRQVYKRTGIYLKTAKTTHQQFADVRCEAVPGPRRIKKLPALAVAENQRIEGTASNGVAGYYEVLSFIDPQAPERCPAS